MSLILLNSWLGYATHLCVGAAIHTHVLAVFVIMESCVSCSKISIFHNGSKIYVCVCIGTEVKGAQVLFTNFHIL